MARLRATAIGGGMPGGRAPQRNVMALGRYQRQRRLALFAILVSAFMALLFVGSAWPEEIHETIEMVGLALIVIGIAGRIWCTL